MKPRETPPTGRLVAVVWHDLLGSSVSDWVIGFGAPSRSGSTSLASRLYQASSMPRSRAILPDLLSAMIAVEREESMSLRRPHTHLMRQSEKPQSPISQPENMPQLPSSPESGLTLKTRELLRPLLRWSLIQSARMYDANERRRLALRESQERESPEKHSSCAVIAGAVDATSLSNLGLECFWNSLPNV